MIESFVFGNFVEWVTGKNKAIEGIEQSYAEYRETADSLYETLDILNNYDKYDDNYIFCALSVILYHIQIKNISELGIEHDVINTIQGYLQTEQVYSKKKCFLKAASCFVCYYLKNQKQFDWDQFRSSPISLCCILENLKHYRSCEFTSGIFSEDGIILYMQELIQNIPEINQNCLIATIILKLKTCCSMYLTEILIDLNKITDFKEIDSELFLLFLRELSDEIKFNCSQISDVEIDIIINFFIRCLDAYQEIEYLQQIWDSYIAFSQDMDFFIRILSLESGSELFDNLLDIFISSEIYTDSEEYRLIQDFISHLSQLPPEFPNWGTLVQCVATIGSDFAPSIMRMFSLGYEKFCNYQDQESGVEKWTTFQEQITELFNNENTCQGIFAIVAYSSIRSLPSSFNASIFTSIFESIKTENPYDGLAFISNYFTQNLTPPAEIPNFDQNLVDYLCYMIEVSTTQTMITLKEIVKSSYEFPIEEFLDSLMSSECDEESFFAALLQLILASYPKVSENSQEALLGYITETIQTIPSELGEEEFIDRFSLRSKSICSLLSSLSLELVPDILQAIFSFISPYISEHEEEIQIPIGNIMISILDKVDIVPSEVIEYIGIIFPTEVPAERIPIVSQHIKLLQKITKCKIEEDGSEHLANVRQAIASQFETFSVFDPDTSELLSFCLSAFENAVPKFQNMSEWITKLFNANHVSALENLFNEMFGCRYILENTGFVQFLEYIDLSENQDLSSSIFDLLKIMIKYEGIDFLPPQIIANGLISPYRNVSDVAIDIFALLLEVGLINDDLQKMYAEALSNMIFQTIWIPKAEDITDIFRMLGDNAQIFLEVAENYGSPSIATEFLESLLYEEEEEYKELVISRFSFWTSSRVYWQLPASQIANHLSE